MISTEQTKFGQVELVLQVPDLDKSLGHEKLLLVFPLDLEK